jgi:hypothetical protein
MNPAVISPSRDAGRMVSKDGLSLPVDPSADLVHVAVVPPSEPILAVAVALVVAGFGIVASVALVRRSRHRRPPATLVTSLAPAHRGRRVGTSRHRRPRRPPDRAISRAAGTHGGGDVAVLVAVLGEPTAVADVNPVLRSVGRHLGQVTLARPVDVGEARRGWADTKQAAIRTLSHAALFVQGPPPRLVLIGGRGEQAVARYAATQAVGVVVLVGDPEVDPDLCRRPELWDCTIVVVS